MNPGKPILSDEKFEFTLLRLCHQLIENYGDFEQTCILGVQPRGVFLADRMMALLQKETGGLAIPYGKLDITFYRDDFRHRDKPITANETTVEFLLDNLRVVLIDDVLYSGRTIQAALTALNDYGRPDSVELLTLIDRRFNRHLPIEANYVGMVVDALDEAYVKVDWNYEESGLDRVLLYQKRQLAE